MVKNYIHENLKHRVIKQLIRKIKKYSNFQTVIVPNNNKHYHIKQYWQFHGVTTKWYYKLFHSLYQTLVTLSGSFSQTISDTFPDIKQ